MAKLSWNTVEQKIIDEILKDKKAFYKRCMENYLWGHLVFGNSATTGWQFQVRKEAAWDPNRASRMLIIGRALQHIPYVNRSADAVLGINTLDKLEKRFGHRLISKWENRKYVQILNPSHTFILKELMERGFKQVMDIPRGSYIALEDYAMGYSTEGKDSDDIILTHVFPNTNPVKIIKL